MVRVYLCGSFKFAEQIEAVEKILEAGGLTCAASKTLSPEGITGCLEKIDAADAIYVVDPGGYIGKSVALDLGYAFARGVPVFLMHPLEDPPVEELVEDCVSPEALIQRLLDEST